MGCAQRAVGPSCLWNLKLCLPHIFSKEMTSPTHPRPHEQHSPKRKCLTFPAMVGDIPATFPLSSNPWSNICNKNTLLVWVKMASSRYLMELTKILEMGTVSYNVERQWGIVLAKSWLWLLNQKGWFFPRTGQRFCPSSSHLFIAPFFPRETGQICVSSLVKSHSSHANSSLNFPVITQQQQQQNPFSSRKFHNLTRSLELALPKQYTLVKNIQSGGSKAAVIAMIRIWEWPCFF